MSCRPLPRVSRFLDAAGLLAVLVLSVAGPPPAQAQLGGPPPPPPPGEECEPFGGGTAMAGNCPSWGGWVKAMPGTICTMNVGNNFMFTGYTNKIRNCSEASDRAQGIAGDSCDVINIIELNTELQCECACDRTNLCDLWDPTFHKCLRDKPGRPAHCIPQGYYEEDRCRLCKGCGRDDAPSCLTQAEEICDPDHYDITCTEVPEKGCDCFCVKNGDCSVSAGSCDLRVIRSPSGQGCDEGNYATCQKCDLDGDGGYDYGTCVAHPPHCNSSSDDRYRQTCLRTCSTPILEGAAQFLADARVRVISGDMNCDPDECGVVFGACPWIDLMASYGLEVCPTTGPTTLGNCTVDFVLSNVCGCGQQTSREPASGDHDTIVFTPGPASWPGPLIEILDARSFTSCPDPDAQDASRDFLGGFAGCPAVDDGVPVPACYSWGETHAAKLRYTSPVDECFLDPENPSRVPVLVCDIATATAWARCSPDSSSSASSFAKVGRAEISQGAGCVDGEYSSSPPAVEMKPEIVMPGLVESSGTLYFEVERDATRGRLSECSAPLGVPCPEPVDITPALLARERALGAGLGNKLLEVCVAPAEEPADE